MAIIDLHSHILPGIDDGSRDMAESRELLIQARDQGITHMLATPHFYADQHKVDRFLAKRSEALEAVRELCGKEEGLPQIRAAAEVYYFPEMGRASMIPKLCAEDSSLLLLEMPFTQWTKGMYRDVETLAERSGMTVILAHVERYYKLQRDRSVWDSILELPVYLQVNAGALMDMRRRRIILKLFREGRPMLMGSDCHRRDTRPCNLAAGREVIQRKLGAGALEEVDMRGRTLLKI